MISMSWSDASRYSGGVRLSDLDLLEDRLGSNTFMPVLMPRSRASREEETIVAASVA